LNTDTGTLQATDTSPASGKLRLGFVGGAFDSAVGRVHRIALEMDQRFELVAGCFSRVDSKNKQSAKLYGVDAARTYLDLESLLKHESESLDAIVILTPTNQHTQQIKECLVAGMAVICEKALVTSVADAKEIRGLIDAGSGFLNVTYNYTGYPMLREFRAMVQAGKLGRLEQMHIEMPQEGFAKLALDGSPIVPQAWRLHDDGVPTVALDLGVHVHSIVKFLTSQFPQELVAVSNTFGNFNQIVDSVSCIAKYSENLVCNIWFCKTALGHRNGLKVRLYGSHGALEWYQDNPEYLNFTDQHGRKSMIDRADPGVTATNHSRYNRFKAGHPAGFIEAFANCYYDIADSLLDYKLGRQPRDNPYVFGVEEALEGLSMLEAIAASSKSKSWVQVQ
jgi:predicted dehydrogenase